MLPYIVIEYLFISAAPISYLMNAQHLLSSFFLSSFLPLLITVLLTRATGTHCASSPRCGFHGPSPFLALSASFYRGQFQASAVFSAKDCQFLPTLVCQSTPTVEITTVLAAATEHIHKNALIKGRAGLILIFILNRRKRRVFGQHPL